MKLSPLFVSLWPSTPLLFVQFSFFATLSYGFLSTAFLQNSASSPQLSPFPKPPIQSSVKGSTSFSSWSKIAEFDVRSSSFHLVDVDDVSAIGRSATCHERNESSSYILEHDLVSPRGWLEYCEASQTRIRQLESSEQQRQNDSFQSNLEGEEGGGAYTVLRCDFLLGEKSWKIWGKDYHLNRLRKSYRSLLQQVSFDRGKHQEIDSDEHYLKYEKSALDFSLEVINLLLEEAKTTILRKNDPNEIVSTEKGGKAITIVMLTLLWDLDHKGFQNSDNGETFIRVQGHAFSTMKASQMQNDSDVDGTSGKIVTVGSNPNTSVQVVIGYLPPTTIECIINRGDCSGPHPTFLPNRYQNFPQAKLSSWCRRRRLLEDTFKTENIGDIILTKHCDDEKTDTKRRSSSSSSISVGLTPETAKSSVQLLEGLTTNLFVLYPGNTLRTAPSTHVLGGFVRQLIIDCAERCGYKVETGSISLADSSFWEEIFLTSSIRLIVPVNRIFLPNANNIDEDKDLFQLETLWEQKSDCRSPLAASNALYMELMRLATQYECESEVMYKKSTD